MLSVILLLSLLFVECGASNALSFYSRNDGFCHIFADKPSDESMNILNQNGLQKKDAYEIAPGKYVLDLKKGAQGANNLCIVFPFSMCGGHFGRITFFQDDALFLNSLESVLNANNFSKKGGGPFVTLGSDAVRQIGLTGLLGIFFDKKYVPIAVEEVKVLTKEVWQGALERYVDKGVAALLVYQNQTNFSDAKFLNKVIEFGYNVKYTDLKWYEKVVSCFDARYSNVRMLVEKPLYNTVRNSHSFRRNLLCWVVIPLALLGLVLKTKFGSR